MNGLLSSSFIYKQNFNVIIWSGVAALCCFGLYIFAVIICALTKKNVKKRIRYATISIIAVTLIIVTTAGGIVADNRISKSKDGWFFEIRKELKTDYPIISKVDLDLALGGTMGLDFYLDDKESDDENLLQSSIAIFNRLALFFLEEGGIEKAKSSWVNRASNGYGEIQNVQRDEIEVGFSKKSTKSCLIAFSSAKYFVSEENNDYEIWKVHDWLHDESGQFIPPYVPGVYLPTGS